MGRRADLKLSVECGACVSKWVYERMAPHVDAKERQSLKELIGVAVDSGASGSCNPGILCNRTVYATQELASGTIAFFETFKRRSNEEAEKLLAKAMMYITQGQSERERLQRACMIAAAANVSPLGAPSEVFSFPEVKGIMEGEVSAVLMGEIYDFFRSARHVLYVTDNAGEIGFDSLLMAQLKKMGLEISLVVKEDPFFEDAMVSDAEYFGLDQLADRIVTSKGFLAASADELSMVSEFRQCDLIIGKGTGSFESLKGEETDKKAVFLLKAKCGVIAADAGVEEGKILVMAED
jgi:damage-control phosphatase, subfamily I